MPTTMRRLRLLALSALALAAAACSSDSSSAPTPVRRVALFSAFNFDTLNLDYGDEATNMYLVLKGKGFATKPFADVSDSALAAVTASADVVVLPEDSWSAIGGISDAGWATLRTFAQQGGTVIVTYDGAPIINGLVDAELEGAYPDSDYTRYQGTAAQGTTFEGGPERLSYHDDSQGIKVSSLPAGAKAVYTGADGAASAAWVAVFPKGQGQVIYLAWDWYGSEPLGAQGTGWNDVLARAVRY